MGSDMYILEDHLGGLVTSKYCLESGEQKCSNRPDTQHNKARAAGERQSEKEKIGGV